MRPLLSLMVMVIASAILGCEPPPPPSSQPSAKPKEESKAAATAKTPAPAAPVLEEAVVSSQGILVHTFDNKIRVMMPAFMPAPTVSRILEKDGSITRWMSQAADGRLCLAGWNKMYPEFFDRVAKDSYLNIAVRDACKQMGGTVEKEENFELRGEPCRRLWLQSPADDPAKKPAGKDAKDAKGKPAPAAASATAAPAAPAAPAPGAKGKMIYARYDYIIAPPFFFQIAFQSNDRADLDLPAVKAFFESFQHRP